MTAIDIQTASKLTKPKKTAEVADKKIQIPKLDLGVFAMTLEGETPLKVQKFSEKAIRMIEEKQQKKAKTARPARDPVAEYEASLYVIDAEKEIYGIPAGGLKNCAVTAAGFVEGIFKTEARGTFHILADTHGLIPIISKAGPHMESDMVRLSGPGRPADVRYRAQFDDWKLQFRVQYNKNMISAEQILNLFENGGFAVGLCEHRPEKNGNLGRFRVSRD